MANKTFRWKGAIEPDSNSISSSNSIHRWKGAIEPLGFIPIRKVFNLESATYTGKSWPTGNYESQGYGISWGDSGNKFYVVGTSGDDINQFSASTPYDISTLSYVQTKLLGTEERNPQGLHWKPDGTAFFGTSSYIDQIFKYTLSTAWNVSTATYSQKVSSLSPSLTSPIELSMSSDGTVAFIFDWILQKVYQYSLGTAWNLSTWAYDSVSFTPSVAPYSVETQFVSVWSDGTHLFMMGYDTNSVWHWKLGTAWDLSTIGSVEQGNLDISANSISNIGLTVKPDGTAIWTTSDEHSPDNAYQYFITPGLVTRKSRFVGFV